MTDDPIEGEIIEEAGTELVPAVAAHEALIARGEITVDEVVAQKDKISQVMQRVMTPDVHYGVIPGTTKPTLLKPGAEAILVALRLAPHYESEKIIDGPHLTVFVKCELHHIPTGLVIATGEGMCSSMEEKYAYRNAKRHCPSCGAAAIIKGKAEYGGGWVCWKKEGGCGQNYAEDAPGITGQVEGKVDNPNLPDTWNTVLKMADKRALIAAVLNGTAASDVFTQDVEDAAPAQASENPRSSQPPPRRADGPERYPVPKSWPKVLEAFRKCDNPDESEALYEAFLRAATYHLYGQTSLKEISKEARAVMLQKAAGAVCWLHDTDAGRDGPFSFFLEAQHRSAWATVLDGTALEIPDYEYVPDTASAQAEADSYDEEAARIAAEVFSEGS